MPAVSGTPTVVESGTLYAPSGANTTDQRSYWIPSIVVSGQGHAAQRIGERVAQSAQDPRGRTLSVRHQAETVDSVIAAAPGGENRIPDGGNWDGADDPALQARRDTEEQVQEQKQAPST